MKTYEVSEHFKNGKTSRISYTGEKSARAHFNNHCFIHDERNTCCDGCKKDIRFTTYDDGNLADSEVYERKPYGERRFRFS